MTELLLVSLDMIDDGCVLCYSSGCSAGLWILDTHLLYLHSSEHEFYQIYALNEILYQDKLMDGSREG
jgi:hypothetical protein